MTSDLPQFIPFGHAHLGALACVYLSVILLPLLLSRPGQRSGRIVALLIAAFLFANEISVFLLDVVVYKLPVAASLPLQLCSVAALLTAWMLWRQSYRAYEIAWFWGIGGSTVALLTPDLSVGYPHKVFIHFFAGHGLIMLGVVHATIAYRFRPDLRSVGKAIIVSIILMLAVGLANHLLGTNYMYLCAKPAQTTLIDYMGSWPWYLGSMLGAGSIVYLVCYLPFLFERRVRAIKSGHE